MYYSWHVLHPTLFLFMDLWNLNKISISNIIVNWILTFQRHIFPSSSRVTPGLTDPWRWRLCVLLKHQNHIIPCYKAVSQKNRALCYSAAKIWKPAIPSISYTCMYCCYFIYGTHHFLPNNTPWTVLTPTNTRNILI